MTVLENEIRIDAPPEKVWSALASLDALAEYDPGVSKAEVVSETKQGPGAARKCDLAPGGWFKERVGTWRPNEALSFELYECTLPVRALRHSYTLVADAGGTVVRQRMEYRLKFGPLGTLLDALIVRRKWSAGIHGFFSGLKRYVESGGHPAREGNADGLRSRSR
ncbi:MAG TPA: SRPBCC family protein [Polyangia bacterium]|jgi:ligand-binding SRPBCC domain-containing protein|nr:SRPBCC family protein [Polyangia bacterium]